MSLTPIEFKPMTEQNIKKRGRPPIPRGDVVDVTYPAKISANILEKLKDRKESNGIPVATQIRQAVERDLEGWVHPSMVGTDSFRAKFLTKAPCGDWKEAIDFASDYTLSSDVAHALEARTEDVIVQSEGDSMEEARIYDGDLVLMRPLQDGRRPVRGEITLVQIIRENGECEGMIKRWMRSEPAELHNGKGEVVPIPKDTVEIRAVAVARGLIARL